MTYAINDGLEKGTMRVQFINVMPPLYIYPVMFKHPSSHNSSRMNLRMKYHLEGHTAAELVEPLCYKPGGRGFNS
jgi:hypothetical protein